MDRVQGLNNHLEAAREDSKAKDALHSISLEAYELTLFCVIQLIKIVSCGDRAQQLLNCVEEGIAGLR